MVLFKSIVEILDVAFWTQEINKTSIHISSFKHFTHVECRYLKEIFNKVNTMHEIIHTELG